MITSIRIQDFKGHRDSIVPLGRLTMLVGPNGSGKTSVLDALSLQSELATHTLDQVLVRDRAYEDLLRRGAKGPVGLTSKGSTNDTDWTCRLELTESAMACHWEQGVDVLKFQVSPSQSLRERTGEITSLLGPAVLFKLNAGNIAAPAYSDRTTPDIEQDGSNTAAALAAMKLGHDEEFARIEESLRRIIPSVARVRIRQVPVQRRTAPVESVMGSKVFFDFNGAPGVPAHAASEGTLITLALLAILHGPNRPKVLLLDNFAESLHPQAQVEFVRLIKGLLEEYKDLQIVATTHSPYVLSELNPFEVHAFALREDGTVATKSLAEHPQAQKMKGRMTAGQLWSLDPEREWVLAEPAP
jgi:predicted ATPase